MTPVIKLWINDFARVKTPVCPFLGREHPLLRTLYGVVPRKTRFFHGRIPFPFEINFTMKSEPEGKAFQEVGFKFF